MQVKSGRGEVLHIESYYKDGGVNNEPDRTQTSRQKRYHR
jgi:hypothetical protein